jgi:hypothetical protein
MDGREGRSRMQEETGQERVGARGGKREGRGHKKDPVGEGTDGTGRVAEKGTTEKGSPA